jgi:hypothetical protein
MTGTRFGLPCQHRLALEIGRNAFPLGTTGDDHEALTGFATQDVKSN